MEGDKNSGKSAKLHFLAYFKALKLILVVFQETTEISVYIPKILFTVKMAQVTMKMPVAAAG